MQHYLVVFVIFAGLSLAHEIPGVAERSDGHPGNFMSQRRDADGATKKIISTAMICSKKWPIACKIGHFLLQE